MSELVKEIEEAEGTVSHLVHMLEDNGFAPHSLLNVEKTLQRAGKAITAAQEELRELSEAQDTLGRPGTAKQLMDIHDILEYLPTKEEKRDG